MSTQRLGLRVFGIELSHQFAPQQTSCAHLGDFHEGVHGDAPEEGKTRCEFIYVKAHVHAGTDVFDTVGEGVGKLQVCGSSSFLDVVTGDGDGVEARHHHRGVFEDVGDDAHGWLRWVDVGVTHHELFQNVILNSSGKFFRGYALFFSCDDVERQDREDGTVHGHGDGDAAEVDTFEELAHIQDGVNGHTCHADVTNNSFVVGVVAAVCC